MNEDVSATSRMTAVATNASFVAWPTVVRAVDDAIHDDMWFSTGDIMNSSTQDTTECIMDALHLEID